MKKGKFNCQKDMYGKIHITNIDTMNKFISGIFEFDAVNEKDDNDTDTVKIRQGRFDCKFLY